LIERSKKNFRLTPEGDVLYEHCKKILQMHDSLRSKLQRLKMSCREHPGGHNLQHRAACAAALCESDSMKNFPGVNVHVEYRRPDQVNRGMWPETSMDIGLVAYPARDSRLEVVLLRKDPLVLIAAPEHPIAREGKVSISALNGLKFVSFDRDIPHAQSARQDLKDHEIEVRHVVELDNVRDSQTRGRNWFRRCRSFRGKPFKQEVEGQTLRKSRLKAISSRPLAAIYKKNKVLSPATRKFISDAERDVRLTRLFPL